jgi:hypothetical protein
LHFGAVAEALSACFNENNRDKEATDVRDNYDNEDRLMNNPYGGGKWLPPGLMPLN